MTRCFCNAVPMTVHDDVAFLHRLADAADAVSRPTSGRRSCERRRRTTALRCPKSTSRSKRRCWLSFAREGDDAVLGEEVGAQPGSSNRRWIFDGIDGTHNYADGRPGWGTIIALEVDGTVELGMVSAPLWGRRWWAVRGAGAWSAPYRRGWFVRRCRGRTVAMRHADVARRCIDHRDPVGGSAARLAQHRAEAVPSSRVDSQPMLRPRRGDGRRRNARRVDHRVRRHLGLRRDQPDRARIRRRVPRRVGRRATRHVHRRVHQRGADRWCARRGLPRCARRPRIDPKLAKTVSDADRHTGGAGDRRMARVRHPPAGVDVGSRTDRRGAIADPGHRRRACAQSRATAARRDDRWNCSHRSALARRSQGRHPPDRRCRQCIPAGADSRPTRHRRPSRWTPRSGGCGSTST